MARAIDKQPMLDLIIEAKRTDPETGSFAEWLAEYLVERLPTLTPPNEPLTLEELRGMRGEPVYVVKGKCQWWDIVDFTAGGWLYLRIANKTDLALDDYGTKWLAYRRKPEVQDG